MEHRRFSEPLALRQVLAVLRRRWWIVVLAALIAPAVAVAVSRTQEPVYESSSEVLLRNENLGAALTGTIDYSVNRDPARIAETQAQLARAPEVAEATIEAARIPGLTAGDLLGASSVSAAGESDLLTFRVRNGDSAAAQTLATQYARQFIAYRLQLDTAAIERARRELQARIREVRGEGGQAELLSSLIEKDQTLQTIRSLQTSNALLVRAGNPGGQISPNPVRNGLLGLGLGIILGLGLAFLREALDTRVRSAEEVSERLGLTLLARLPEPPRRLRAGNRLVMMEDPGGVQAEAFRMLRTNLEFVNIDRAARTIAVTSAINEEGKSTTAANLAVALALTGSRVVLVDLDLRRPMAHRFFGLADRPGVTDVAAGAARLDDALVAIPLEVDEPSGVDDRGTMNGRAERAERLMVLPSGTLPRDVGEFVGSRDLGDLIRQLRERSDLVIVDTPPLLRVGDVMAMSVSLDALVIVARINVVSRPMLSEMGRLLGRMRAAKLGVITTGAQAGDAYGGAGYYGYGYAGTPATGDVTESHRR